MELSALGVREQGQEGDVCLRRGLTVNRKMQPLHRLRLRLPRVSAALAATEYHMNAHVHLHTLSCPILQGPVDPERSSKLVELVFHRRVKLIAIWLHIESDRARATFSSTSMIDHSTLPTVTTPK